jgi:hypothetical protein
MWNYPIASSIAVQLFLTFRAIAQKNASTKMQNTNLPAPLDSADQAS